MVAITSEPVVCYYGKCDVCGAISPGEQLLTLEEAEAWVAKHREEVAAGMHTESHYVTD
jgi:hypothetical protein